MIWMNSLGSRRQRYQARIEGVRLVQSRRQRHDNFYDATALTRWLWMYSCFSETVFALGRLLRTEKTIGIKVYIYILTTRSIISDNTKKLANCHAILLRWWCYCSLEKRVWTREIGSMLLVSNLSKSAKRRSRCNVTEWRPWQNNYGSSSITLHRRKILCRERLRHHQNSTTIRYRQIETMRQYDRITTARKSCRLDGRHMD